MNKHFLGQMIIIRTFYKLAYFEHRHTIVMLQNHLRKIICLRRCKKLIRIFEMFANRKRKASQVHVEKQNNRI